MSFFCPSRFNSSAAAANYNLYGQMTLTWLDKTPATGTNNYYLGSISRTSSTVKCYTEVGALPFGCTLMEIQQ